MKTPFPKPRRSLLLSALAGLCAASLSASQPSAVAPAPAPASAATPAPVATAAPVAQAPAPAARPFTAMASELPAELPETCYLFSYFINKGRDGLHLAWSADGYTWTEVPGAPFLAPTLDDKLMRDPSIQQGPDGVFHLVWTSSWTTGGFGHASSTDLVHWSEPQRVPAMEHEPLTQNTWAPELVFDKARDCWLILWSSTITGRFASTDPARGEGGAAKPLNHRLYSTTTRDWKTFTPTTLFYDDGYSVIDALIVPVDDRFAMVVKDERIDPTPRKDLRVAWARALAGPYGPSAPSFSRALVPQWLEGPALARIGGKWFLYADAYRDHHYVLLTSEDFASWKDETPRLRHPEGLRHGTVFPVSREILRGLYRPAR